MRAKNVNMLSGPLYKNMIKFAIPVWLTTLLSLAFNAVDLIVVGQFCGSHAIAAVGATSRIVNLLTFLFLGFATGYGVVLGHALGEKDDEKVSRTIHTGIPFAALLGLVLTVIGIALAEKFLGIMNTPDDIMADAALYLRIYFAGAVLRMIQAFLIPLFRAAGDTKVPLLFMIIGGILNVCFNLFFVLCFDMSVDGVAYGTIISEGAACIIGLFILMRRKDSIRFTLKKMRLDFEIIKKTVKIGVPCGLQSCMYSLSTAVLSSAVNSLGTTVIAANSAALNIDDVVIHSTVNAYSATVTAFTGQNYGAKQYERLWKIIKTAIISGTLLVFALGVLVNVFSKPLLSIYITDNPEAIELGRIKMLISGGLYFLHVTPTMLSGGLEGMGQPQKPMVASFFTVCLLKVVWVYTLFRIPALHNYACLAFSYPASWLLSGVVDIFLFRSEWKRIKRRAKIVEMEKQNEKMPLEN